LPSRVPFWLILGTSVRLAASSDPIMLFRLASPTNLRTAESRTLIVEGDKDSMPARHSINKDGREVGWCRYSLISRTVLLVPMDLPVPLTSRDIPLLVEQSAVQFAKGRLAFEGETVKARRCKSAGDRATCWDQVLLDVVEFYW
jgi:hypothetical protein